MSSSYYCLLSLFEGPFLTIITEDDAGLLTSAKGFG